MLRPGLIVLTARGKVELRGRNGCNLAQWWGFPYINGRPDRRRMWIGFARDIHAIETDYGFQCVLPGLLETP